MSEQDFSVGRVHVREEIFPGRGNHGARENFLRQGRGNVRVKIFPTEAGAISEISRQAKAIPERGEIFTTGRGKHQARGNFHNGQVSE